MTWSTTCWRASARPSCACSRAWSSRASSCSRRENGLIELLRAEPADVASLVAGSGLPEARARRLLYLLAITKAAAPYDGERGTPRRADSTRPTRSPQAARGCGRRSRTPQRRPRTVAPANPQRPRHRQARCRPPTRGPGTQGAMHGQLDRLQSIPPPPAELPDEINQRWLRVVTKGRLIENQNYFEMLEVDKDTKSGDARAQVLPARQGMAPRSSAAPRCSRCASTCRSSSAT